VALFGHASSIQKLLGVQHRLCCRVGDHLGDYFCEQEGQTERLPLGLRRGEYRVGVWHHRPICVPAAASVASAPVAFEIYTLGTARLASLLVLLERVCFQLVEKRLCLGAKFGRCAVILENEVRHPVRSNQKLFHHIRILVGHATRRQEAEALA
jgi:hypothetical protein